MNPTIFCLFFAAICASAQTAATASVPAVPTSLPTYIMAGVSYNQYTGGAGFVSAIVPESNSAGLYGSATTDVVPIKITDQQGKSAYLLSASARAGQHKIVYQNSQNMLLIGGDFGASFSSTPTSSASSSPTGQASSAGVTIGMAGSFTVTYVRQFSPHFAFGMPIRMLWMSGVGPNGSGAWNPVVEAGIIWKP